MFCRKPDIYVMRNGNAFKVNELEVNDLILNLDKGKKTAFD